MGDIAKALVRSQWPTGLNADAYAAELVNFNGHTYLTNGISQTIRGHSEDIDGSFVSLVQQAYKSNGIVFACMLARMRVFRQARFQFQELRNGQPGDLFGNSTLDVLEVPWRNATTADLLARAIQDADLSGNFFATRRGKTIYRLRPDWVTIVLGSPNDPVVEAGDIDAEVLGYMYHPGGKNSGRTAEVLLADEVAHFAPIPDPTAAFRGMSWLTPVMREISGDSAMTDHKNLYLANGATPNMVVTLDKDVLLQAFNDWVDKFKEREPKGFDVYKTLYLGAGAVATVVGSDLQKVDFKNVQGAGETRIAAAAGVPPVIVGLSEGLAAATYSNYGQARRAFADNTLRDLWQDIAGSLQTLVPAPSGSRLWYDDRYIQALAEDKKDRAEISLLRAQTLRTLLEGGYKADAGVAYVETDDLSRLKGQHTGLFSVQLQAPGSTKMPAGEAPGESPVGSGTAPAKVPAGPSTKPTSSVASGPRMFMGISFGELRQLLADGWEPAGSVDAEIIRRAFVFATGSPAPGGAA